MVNPVGNAPVVSNIKGVNSGSGLEVSTSAGVSTVMVAAIQELSAKNDALEARIASLENA